MMGLREQFKLSLKHIGCKGLIRTARGVRNKYYRFWETGGKLLFFILRYFHILPEIKPFDSKRINKIMIIRADRIGDLILSTPSFAALRKRFPNAYISLIVRSYTKDLVFDNPMIDEVIAFDSDMPLLRKLRFLLSWRKEQYDLAVVLHSTIWWCLLAYLSSAPYRIVYEERGGGFLLTYPILPKQDNEVLHELDNTLDIVRIVGADVNDKHPYVCVTKQGESFAEAFFRDNGIGKFDKIVAMHPGARQEYIRWRKEGFAALADMIIEKYSFKILFIGGESERDLVKDIYRLIKEKNYTVPAIDIELTELVSLIKRCVLFVGNSTGPMHIAAALQVPVIAIFGSVHPQDSYKKWGPWGEGHVVVSKDFNCYDCHPSDCNTYDCMNLIEPEDVMKAVDNQIGKRNNCF